MEDKAVDQKLITTRIIEGKPKHDAIYSVATGKDGKIYLGLSTEVELAPGSTGRPVKRSGSCVYQWVQVRNHKSPILAPADVIDNGVAGLIRTAQKVDCVLEDSQSQPMFRKHAV